MLWPARDEQTPSEIALTAESGLRLPAINQVSIVSFIEVGQELGLVANKILSFLFQRVDEFGCHILSRHDLEAGVAKRIRVFADVLQVVVTSLDVSSEVGRQFATLAAEIGNEELAAGPQTFEYLPPDLQFLRDVEDRTRVQARSNASAASGYVRMSPSRNTIGEGRVPLARC